MRLRHFFRKRDTDKLAGLPDPTYATYPWGQVLQLHERAKGTRYEKLFAEIMWLTVEINSVYQEGDLRLTQAFHLVYSKAFVELYDLLLPPLKVWHPEREPQE